jgi:hypothetical protein
METWSYRDALHGHAVIEAVDDLQALARAEAKKGK